MPLGPVFIDKVLKQHAPEAPGTADTSPEMKAAGGEGKSEQDNDEGQDKVAEASAKGDAAKKATEVDVKEKDAPTETEGEVKEKECVSVPAVATGGGSDRGSDYVYTTAEVRFWMSCTSSVLSNSPCVAAAVKSTYELNAATLIVAYHPFEATVSIDNKEWVVSSLFMPVLVPNPVYVAKAKRARNENNSDSGSEEDDPADDDDGPESLLCFKCSIATVTLSTHQPRFFLIKSVSEQMAWCISHLCMCVWGNSAPHKHNTRHNTLVRMIHYDYAYVCVCCVVCVAISCASVILQVKSTRFRLQTCLSVFRH